MNMERCGFGSSHRNISAHVQCAHSVSITGKKAIVEKKPLVVEIYGVVVVVESYFQFAVLSADLADGKAFPRKMVVFLILARRTPHPLPVRNDKVVRTCDRRTLRISICPIYGIRKCIILVPDPGIIPSLADGGKTGGNRQQHQ